MIQPGRASFTVTSTETDPERISELLGLIPTRIERRGADRQSDRARTHNMWSIDGNWLSNSEADQTGTGASTELITRTRAAAGKIQTLPTDCKVRIWWSADSDSTQGEFVISPELCKGIAELGVDVFATVYFDADTDADAGADD